MAGTIVADDIQHSTAGSVGTEYVVDAGSKGYCRSQGTGTPSIAISMNTSSITDNGTGDQTFSFTNSFSQDICCTTGTETGAWASITQILVNGTSSTRLKTHNSSGGHSAGDDIGKHVCYQGNLA